MNGLITQSLVELIILNIGYDANVINDRIFAIMILMTIITTITSSPLASWIYSIEYQKKIEIKRLEQNGTITRLKSSDTKYNDILLVLNKIEWLPSMMTLAQLLQPLQNKENEIQEKIPPKISQSTSTEHKNDEQLVVHALRIIELTQRLSTVMKFNELEQTILRDPIMNVFRMFDPLNFVNIKAKFSVVPIQNFAKQIAESARDTRSEIIIITWDGAGAIIDDPNEEIPELREKKHTSLQVSNFVQEVFIEVDTSIGFLIDRRLGLGTERKANTMLSSGTTDIHIYLPFFGGIDDREALSFVVRLSNNPNVTTTIIRIRKSNNPTANDTTLKRDINNDNIESQRPPLEHEISTASGHILNTNEERQLSDEADNVLLREYFKPRTGKLINNPRINYSEISSATALQTAVERGKEIVTHKDLVIVGRGRRNANLNHRSEFIEILRNLGLSYGNDTRRCLGDIAEAFLVGQIPSSIFVIQGKEI